MEQLWFQEDLVAAPAALDQAIKSLRGQGADTGKAQVEGSVSAVIRFTKPRWGELDREKMQFLGSGGDSRFILVRLGFEFDLSPNQRKAGSRFVFARCSSCISPTSDATELPTVYDVIPKDLYDGEPQTMQVKISPTIGLGPVNASLGELATNFTIGHVEPAVVGWAGEDDRQPYWELRPASKSIIGTRYLWVIVEVPNNCTSFDISACTEAEIETPHIRGILIGPKNREWAKRPKMTIGTIKT